MKTKKIKIFASLLFSVATIAFFACSDESKNKKIVGTWTCTHSHVAYISYYDGSLLDESIDKYKAEIITFKEDGNIEASKYFENLGKNNTWAIIGDSLYFGGKDNAWEIQKLTNSKLKIFQCKAPKSKKYIDVIYEFEK